MISIEKVIGPCELQKAGVDKIVTLDGGKLVHVEEKLRKLRGPEDILLEIEHVDVNGRRWPGWLTKPKQKTDFLALGYPATQTALFIPFVTLQNAWKRNGPLWQKKFATPPAPNPREKPRYFTHNVAIPLETLMGHLLVATRVQLLPTLTVVV